MKELLYRLKRVYHFFTTGAEGYLAAARYHHPEKKLKIILVTGTDGKTTTSSLIYHLLKKSGFKVALLSTVAAYIGDETLDTGFHVTSPEPADLYRYLDKMVTAGMEYLVLELTSQGAYQYRAWGIQAEVAALTNIDRDHLDYHLTYENYLRAKMLVLNAASTAVVNDEAACFPLVKKYLAPGIKMVTFNPSTRFSAPLEKAIREKFAEDYNRLNAILAVTVAKQFGLSDKRLAQAIGDFTLPQGRMELVPNKLGITMIVDFAHTPQALAAVLPAIRKRYVQKNSQFIGIVGCAGLRDHTKRAAMGRLLAEHCDLAIFTSEDPRTENVWSIIQQMKAELSPFHGRVLSIANREEALRFALHHYAQPGNVIAIFGKGHEQSMNYDGQTETLWNDITGAQQIMTGISHGDTSLALEKNNFFLVGIKGVGMTALASCLVDAGKSVAGADTDERFPTSHNLERLAVPITPLDGDLPEDTQVVIYTGSHGGRSQPLVQQAIARGLPVYSHMEALAWFFNRARGIAVCGVGGKSSISAMLAHITAKSDPQSYAVGVGEIIGHDRTGRLIDGSKYFIAEADEYIADPTTIGTSQAHIRFLYLYPQIIICPNLRFDHPDVYRDFAHTQEVFLQFFTQLKTGGVLIYNGDDPHLTKLAAQLRAKRPDVTTISYGRADTNDYPLAKKKIQLAIPGEYNRLNALAAMLAAKQIGLTDDVIRDGLASYRSVKRRLEYLGKRNGVEIWDDYAHHPSEIKAVIAAMHEKYPKGRLVVAFQPHTYSRTKQLFDQFVDALATHRELWLLDIFASAREKLDPSITSQMLAQALARKYPDVSVHAIGTVADLAAKIKTDLHSGDVLLTMGAGDIYHAVTSD